MFPLRNRYKNGDGNALFHPVLIISSLFVVAVPYSVVMKLSITSEFHRTLLERSSIVLGLGSIVTIVCKAFSQPILWDVPKSKLRGGPFQKQLLF